MKRIATIALLCACMQAHAVCLDPKTYRSGYHVPLEDEIANSTLIAVGKVTKEQVQNDTADPEGFDAYIYSVTVVKRLKGKVPKVIKIKSENSSARYPMSIGERHILFLSREGNYFVANSCGNSALLPGGDRTLTEVESTLDESSHGR